MSQDEIPRFEQRQRAFVGDDIAGKAARTRHVLRNFLAPLEPPLRVEGAQADGPHLWQEHRARRDLRPGMGDGDMPIAAGFGVFHAGGDEAIFGHDRPPELGYHPIGSRKQRRRMGA